MGYTNSPLATYTHISPNKTVNRQQPITKITVHHMAGVCTVQQFDNIVKNPNRQMSSNYCIDCNAVVGLFCEEKDRSWCSSSPWNDHRAITIEVSNSAYGDASGWPVSDKVFDKLVDLCTDICKRNGIPKLEFTGDKSGSLTYHYMFSATSCLPIDRTELLTPNGWKLLRDIRVGDVVATAHIDDLSISFDGVESMVPVKTQDTYITHDFEATSDHRVIYYHDDHQYVTQYKDIFNDSDALKCCYRLPNAGTKFYNDEYATSPMRKLSFDEIEYLAAVQSAGHYMKDGNCYYGIEFHLKKQRKIDRICTLLNRLEIPYKIGNKKDGSVAIRIYGNQYYAWCEKYLNDKKFTWEWLALDNEQSTHLLNVILHYDGCKANTNYSSRKDINIDVIQALAATHGVGSKLGDNNTRVYFKKPYRTLDGNVRKRKERQQVSCVTVRSGFILIRQHGRTTITGNCPGPYLRRKTTELCNRVNAKLASATKTPAPKPVANTSTPNNNTTNNIKKDTLVSIASNAVYYNGGSIPSWVKAEKWYISSISGDRAVLGLNEAQNRNIQSPISTKYLTTTKTASSNFKSYTVSLKSTDIVYATAGGKTKGTVGSTGVFTIVDEQTVNQRVYGKLKSGLGWVIVKDNSSIVKGDTVRVINPIIYGTNKKFTVYASKYVVLEIKGDRVVISSDGKNVTTAIAKNNVEKL